MLLIKSLSINKALKQIGGLNDSNLNLVSNEGVIGEFFEEKRMKIFNVKVWFLVVLTLCMMFAQTVEAKRMGGGMSLGRQSAPIARNPSALPPRPAAPPVNGTAGRPSTPPTAAPTPAPSRFGGMGGILGGIAAGIGLSYLFSSMGMGAGMSGLFSNLLMIALIIFGGLWLFRKFAVHKITNQVNNPNGGMSFATASMEPSAASAWDSHQGTHPASDSVSKTTTIQNISNASQLPLIAEVSTNSLNEPIKAQLTPSSFADKDHFLENAKNLFLQLQEASDQQNLEVLREYTSPELFSLLRKDMLSRASAISFTQVLTLAADLIAVEENGGEYMASVRFSGSIREEVNGPVEDFQEIWNWAKPIEGNAGWILVGIQQIN